MTLTASGLSQSVMMIYGRPRPYEKWFLHLDGTDLKSLFINDLRQNARTP